ALHAPEIARVKRTALIRSLMVWPGLAALGVVVSAPMLLGAAANQQGVLFNRDVRPILSENCFPCHGPDSGKRKANLRLDTPDGAIAIHDGRQAVKGGDLQNSEVWRRINSKDAKVAMPPPDSRKKLKPEQIAALREWIQGGGVYQKHWAFEPPV